MKSISIKKIKKMNRHKMEAKKRNNRTIPTRKRKRLTRSKLTYWATIAVQISSRSSRLSSRGVEVINSFTTSVRVARI